MNRSSTSPSVRLAAVLSVIVLGLSACTSAPSPNKTVKKQVRFLHLADMHAQMDTHWEYLPEDPDHLHRMGGFARIKTALDQLRASAPGAVFTADGGDTFQGSAVAAWTKGEAVIAPINALGFDVGIPGNWEVVYGPEAFRKLLNEVSYKVVCYNFEDTVSKQRIFPPAIILEKEGVKVAFVGVTDPTTTTRQPPNQVKGLDSTHMEGLQKFVLDLKAKQHPDLVVLIDHTGLAPSVQIAHDIPEFDIILSGHSHERTYHEIKVGNTIVVEPGSMGSFIGKLDVTVEGGKVTEHQFELVKVEESQYAENAEVKKLVETAERPFRKRLDKVVGFTRTPLLRYDVLEGSMDNLVADAVRAKAHTDMGYTNGFRFSPPIAPGPITEADLWLILPLDARIKAGRVTGKELKAYLENEMELVFAKDPFALSGGWGPRPSGVEIVFHAQGEKGKRIKSVKVGGKEIKDEKSYTMGGCERDGEELDIICRLKGVQEAYVVKGTIHQALTEYIKKNSPLQLVREKRVRADDLPDQVWSQYGMLQKMWGLPGSAEAVKIPESNKP
ncbi:MAG: 5'-nucleotidase C-terminal domain-containing protein [Bdellovibrionales bacterium]|nr:5'-nucleotidase C-terminal domain-containing protein [Oligoflexia bacterium]